MDKTTKYIQYVLFTILLVSFLSLGSISNSIAKENPKFNPLQAESLQDDQNKKSDDTKVSDKDMKLFLNQIEIYGQIAKPQTVFIIPGTDPRVDGLRIDRHFFTHIFRPVEKGTLRRIQIRQGKDKEHILW